MEGFWQSINSILIKSGVPDAKISPQGSGTFLCQKQLKFIKRLLIWLSVNLKLPDRGRSFGMFHHRLALMGMFTGALTSCFCRAIITPCLFMALLNRSARMAELLKREKDQQSSYSGNAWLRNSLMARRMWNTSWSTTMFLMLTRLNLTRSVKSTLPNFVIFRMINVSKGASRLKISSTICRILLKSSLRRLIAVPTTVLLMW